MNKRPNPKVRAGGFVALGLFLIACGVINLNLTPRCNGRPMTDDEVCVTRDTEGVGRATTSTTKAEDEQFYLFMGICCLGLGIASLAWAPVKYRRVEADNADRDARRIRAAEDAKHIRLERQ